MYFVVLCMLLFMVCLALHITCPSEMEKLSEMLLAMLSACPTLEGCVLLGAMAKELVRLVLVLVLCNCAL